MDILALAIGLGFEVLTLWWWLIVNETTSKKIVVNSPLTKLSKLEKGINCLWILGFLLMPLFLSLSEKEGTKGLGLFLLNLIFGKFFWDMVLPAIEKQDTLKDTIKAIVLAPFVLFVSVVLLKIPTTIFDFLSQSFIGSEDTAAKNFGMNFLVDIWPPYLPQYISKIYNFSFAFLTLVTLIILTKLYGVRMKIIYKIPLAIGIFCLLNRTLKYSGSDFSRILSLKPQTILQEYSITNLIIIVVAWSIAIAAKTNPNEADLKKY